MISRIFSHQSKCFVARPSSCFGTMPHIIACVCSPLCHHLYTVFQIVAWVCWFVSKHLLASLHVLAPPSLLPLFILHPTLYDLSLLICLQPPVTSLHVLALHSLLPLFILHPSRNYELSNDNLDKSFSLPRSTGFPRKEYSICPLTPLFAYLQIWNSLIHQNVGSHIRCFFLMRFHFSSDQEGCCPSDCCNPLS